MDEIVKKSQERMAGRSLDAEVASRVLGRRVIKDRNGEWTEFYGDHVEARGFFAQPKPYSSEIAQTFKVVEAMRAVGCEFRLEAGASWIACFDHDLIRAEFTAWEFEESSEFAPLAICRSALALLDEFPELGHIPPPSQGAVPTNPENSDATSLSQPKERNQ